MAPDALTAPARPAMKLLLVARRYPPDVHSGTETVFQALAERARRDHEVRLVLGFTRDRALLPADAVAVDLRGLSPGRAHAALWWAATRELVRWRPDAVLANSIEVPAALAPTVCIVHDLNFGVASRDRGTRARELFYRVKGRRFARVVAVSDVTRASLLALGLPQDQVVVVRNGVDLAQFAPRPRLPEPGEAPGTVRFVCPGRILPGKGQHLAIDALARLPRPLKERASLTIAGAVHDPIYLDQLRVQAWEQPVRFEVDVPSMGEVIARHDVVVFPTVMAEGFGYAAAEGLACGRPVIWSEQPAVREACGGLGLPVPMGDAAALRDAMRRLMEDPALRERLGREGRAFAEERYDWERVWRAYEGLLLTVARR